MTDKTNLRTWTARALAAAALVLASTAGAQNPITIDENLPVYQTTEGISGNLNSVGSDTLNNLMTFWAEAFRKVYPNVNIQIEGKGSSTAPPALIQGLSQLGPMSRPMKASEIDDFEREYGYKPVGIRVAVDALAVFVNKDNPLEGLSVPQVDAIFSKTRRQGLAEDIATWGQVGLTGDWSARPISLYGRNSASGTYGFFKEHTLKNGDFKDEVKEQPGSASVVQGITVDQFGIGYSGIGYVTPGVRALPLSAKAGEAFVEASQQNAYAGTYPLSRYLYVYVNRVPGEGLDPLTREFMRLVLSKEGQEITIKDGYFPLPASVVEEELKKIK
jgi:phosphate transport system substrate-binding protein